MPQLPKAPGCDKNWKELYLEALFENNKSAMQQKIALAQRAVFTRRSQLLSRPLDDTHERQALDTALFSLQALKSCLVMTASAAA
jgi:hypothetical protein